MPGPPAGMTPLAVPDKSGGETEARREDKGGVAQTPRLLAPPGGPPGPRVCGAGLRCRAGLSWAFHTHIVPTVRMARGGRQGSCPGLHPKDEKPEPYPWGPAPRPDHVGSRSSPD